MISRIKIISNLDISKNVCPGRQGRVPFKGRELELRVATLPTVHGESVVLRLYVIGSGHAFDKLNLTERNMEQIERLMRKPTVFFWLSARLVREKQRHCMPF